MAPLPTADPCYPCGERVSEISPGLIDPERSGSISPGLISRPEPWPGSLVPGVRVFDVAGRFGPNNDLAFHRSVVRSRATMSSHGIPVAPSRSTRSSRRSSSCRCDEVKGIECGVSARLSHSCSTNRSRSSTDRRPMSICGVDIVPVSHRRLVLASVSVDAEPECSAAVGCRAALAGP